jgi:predicted lipid carrier protein YhbT
VSLLTSPQVATEAAVIAAIEALRARVNAAVIEDGVVPDRSILCVVPDLASAYKTSLNSGKMTEVVPASASDPADAKLTANSSELVALLEGKLNVAAAFLLGKIRIDASPADLLLIRKLL